MVSDISEYHVKKNDLVFMIQKSQSDDSLIGIMFLYEDEEDSVVIGRKAVELKPPIDFGYLKMPFLKPLEQGDQYSRIQSTAEKIYIGLNAVKRGLFSYPEFEAYGAVADYYKRLQPKLSRFQA